MKEKRTTAHFPHGEPTELWRTFAWCVGETHADRLCWLLDRYCGLWGICPRAFWHPNGKDIAKGAKSAKGASKKPVLRPIRGGK